jgi:hypothetical protein
MAHQTSERTHRPGVEHHEPRIVELAAPDGGMNRADRAHHRPHQHRQDVAPERRGRVLRSRSCSPVGDDQETYFRFYEREVLPRLREL